MKTRGVKKGAKRGSYRKDKLHRVGREKFSKFLHNITLNGLCLNDAYDKERKVYNSTRDSLWVLYEELHAVYVDNRWGYVTNRSKGRLGGLLNPSLDDLEAIDRDTYWFLDDEVAMAKRELLLEEIIKVENKMVGIRVSYLSFRRAWVEKYGIDTYLSMSEILESAKKNI